MQVFLHYFLHLIFPIVPAWLWFRKSWKQAYAIMLLTMLVDLDHLLAQPLFQADRCSIGFHLLHMPLAILVYIGLLLLPGWVRVVAVGLCLHMLTDFIDCLFMFTRCEICYHDSLVYPVLKFVHNLLR